MRASSRPLAGSVLVGDAAMERTAATAGQQAYKAAVKGSEGVRQDSVQSGSAGAKLLRGTAVIEWLGLSTPSSSHRDWCEGRAGWRGPRRWVVRVQRPVCRPATSRLSLVPADADFNAGCSTAAD